jgi:hypothetical protein
VGLNTYICIQPINISTMSKTYDKAVIVMIPVAFTNSSEIAKQFMGKEFKTLGEVAIAVTDALEEDEDTEDEEVLVYQIDNFCIACNDQVFDSLTEYFLTTVYVE